MARGTVSADVKANTQTAEEVVNPYAAPVEPEVGAPRVPAAQLVLASRAARFMAAMIDGVLFGVAMVPGFVIGAVLLRAETTEQTVLAIGYGGLSGILLYLYQSYLIARSGQSLGKRWSQVRIVRQDGSPAGFVHGVLLRAWLFVALGAVPYLGKGLGIADSCLIFRRDQRCLHDLVAGTIVIAV
jgi:uncharacterized RDD family membrane protein YckC